MAAVGSTYTYPVGSVQSATSPLKPFHSNTAGGTFSSNDVRYVHNFGYTYPELTSGFTQSSIRSAVNKLYGNTAGTSTVSSKRDIPNDVGAAAGIESAASNNGTNYQYLCNIVSQKFAMNGSYAVYIFFGEPALSNPKDWANDPNLAGMHAVFANLGDAVQMNGKRDMTVMNQDLKITGAVPLTTPLIGAVASGNLSSVNPTDVGPWLTANMQWRVSMFDGTEVEIVNVPDLSVSVVSAEVTPAAAADEFPVYGAWTALTNVTAGRPGGHQSQYWNCPEDGTPYYRHDTQWHGQRASHHGRHNQ